jgi:Gas vesicle synthesis protein GvpL/GvpF
VIELYAITDESAPPLPEVGDLHVVASDGLAAVCAPAAGGPVSADRLWRHEELVEALMEDRDLLPARYGSRFPDEAAARSALAERHDELVAALERVRGAVELSLRVLGDEPERPALGSGAEYMRAKARSTGSARAVHERLAGLARGAVTRRPPARAELLRAAYLVDRGAVTRFAARVAELQLEHRELQLLCTGPWPPYSFAER